MLFACREMGRQEMETLQKQAEIAKEGFLLKQQLINEAKRQREEKQVRGLLPEEGGYVSQAAVLEC